MGDSDGVPHHCRLRLAEGILAVLTQEDQHEFMEHVQKLLTRPLILALKTDVSTGGVKLQGSEADSDLCGPLDLLALHEIARRMLSRHANVLCDMFLSTGADKDMSDHVVKLAAFSVMAIMTEKCAIELGNMAYFQLPFLQLKLVVDKLQLSTATPSKDAAILK